MHEQHAAVRGSVVALAYGFSLNFLEHLRLHDFNLRKRSIGGHRRNQLAAQPVFCAEQELTEKPKGMSIRLPKVQQAPRPRRRDRREQ